jgi:two-component system, NtrC family, sensor kinase
MHIATILVVGIESPELIEQLKNNHFGLIHADHIDAILAIETAFDLMIISQKLVAGFGSADVERLYFKNNSVPIAVLIEQPEAIDDNLLKILQRGTFECFYRYEIDKSLIGQRVDKLLITTRFDKNLHFVQQSLTEKESLKKEIDFRDQVLKNLQQINANIIASITSGLIILDLRGTIMLANEHLRKSLAIEEETLIGASCSTALPEEIRSIVEAFLRRDPRADPAPVIERCKIKDRFLEIALYWIVNFNEQHSGILVLINDLTELENMNIQLYRAEKLATMGTMLSGIAHELRNPLSIISARAQRGLVKKTYEQAWVHKNFDSIETQSQRCAAIVNSLLDFTRNTASKTGYSKAEEVLEESLTYVAYQNLFDNIEIRKQFQPDLFIFGDRSRFVQIFVNIITNAAQAMNAKGVLTLRTHRQSHSKTLIEICDTGPGIEGAVGNKIFDPFFTTKDPGKGTGLGLSIVHKIVQESGGKIWFASHPGDTTFSILLPALKE